MYARGLHPLLLQLLCLLLVLLVACKLCVLSAGG